MSVNFRKILLIPVWCLVAVVAAAQTPAGYYDPANGLTGKALQQALHDIIDNHTSISYSELWTAFKKTDKKPDGKVWDIYTDIPSGTPVYTFTFGTDQCGNYSVEGDCYNREHSFPKSWFDDQTPMYTDLFHLYPTDGKVNGMRSDYPYGETNSPTYTSSNGSKLGSCSVSGYTGIVFEPIDEYKGDLARTYFYMATRYYGEDGSWSGSPMVTGSQPKAWALTMLLQWSKDDPVSQKEINRNDSIYKIQHNRNPFIDYPLYADMIWGSLSSTDDVISDEEGMTIYPNPASSYLTIALPADHASDIVIQIYDFNGCLTKTVTTGETIPHIDISDLKPGFYLLQVTSGKKRYTERFVVVK
ncbi:MAG TPA: endonuclease [Bacteroidales bacterium]|nr:endonuclease [Bacteroidales bacterium]HPT11129.1 endonuclease [Bacteroidales bacterium]